MTAQTPASPDREYTLLFDLNNQINHGPYLSLSQLSALNDSYATNPRGFSKVPASILNGIGRNWIRTVFNDVTLVINNCFWPPSHGQPPAFLRLATSQETAGNEVISVHFNIFNRSLLYVRAAPSEIIDHPNLVWVTCVGCPPVLAYCEIDVQAPSHSDPNAP